jgi:hypothetical protein
MNVWRGRLRVQYDRTGAKQYAGQEMKQRNCSYIACYQWWEKEKDTCSDEMKASHGFTT